MFFQRVKAWFKTKKTKKESLNNKSGQVAILLIIATAILLIFYASYYALNFATHRATAAVLYRFGREFELRFDSEYRRQRDNPLRAGSDEAFLSSLVASPTDGVRIHALEILRATDDSGLRIRLHSEPGAQPIRERNG